MKPLVSTVKTTLLMRKRRGGGLKTGRERELEGVKKEEDLSFLSLSFFTFAWSSHKTVHKETCMTENVSHSVTCKLLLTRYEM